MFYVHQKYSLYILFSDERKVALIVRYFTTTWDIMALS